MANMAFTVDLNKPLVFQVGHLGDKYQEWVHQPIISKEGPRLFSSDYMEFLTRTAWWAIPLIWLPVVFWFASVAVQMGLVHSQLHVAMAVGIFLWTLLEYMLHRFLFHMETCTYWGNTVHYLFHGIHHKHPMDGLRLVFPPAAAVILCVPVWTLIKIASTPSVAPAVFAGVLLGYIFYDLTHYYLHHGKPSDGLPEHLKRYHMNHHFKVQSKGFGITSSLWDVVFGTHPQSEVAVKKI